MHDPNRFEARSLFSKELERYFKGWLRVMKGNVDPSQVREGIATAHPYKCPRGEEVADETASAEGTKTTTVDSSLARPSQMTRKNIIISLTLHRVVTHLRTTKRTNTLQSCTTISPAMNHQSVQSQFCWPTWSTLLHSL
jgi:hypothetical protein